VTLQISQEELALRQQIEGEQHALAGLQQQMNAVERELEAHAAQREQFELLDQICTSLDRLEEMGAAGLFWGESTAPEVPARHLERVREEASAFCRTIAGIESRRQAIGERIAAQDDALGYLEDELLALQEEEEQRRLEWVIEREGDPLPFHAMVMPWTRGREEDRRFRKSLLASLAASLLLAVVLHAIDLPILDFEELTEVPERLARVIETLPEPPPPAVAQEPEPEPESEPEPEPQEQVAQETPPEPTPEVVEPAAQVAQQQEAPKQRVKSKGILAFRDSFSGRAKAGPSARLGASAKIGNAGDAAVGMPQRAMVTTSAPGSSGGINLANLSRDVGGGGGGGQIGGVQLTQVASGIGGDGSADRPLSGGQAAGRTDEEIQIVFDRYKAAMYRLYNRELRRDPTLRGQLVLRLTIEPDGSVSMCRLQSTDMAAPDLVDQIVARVLGFDFGAKENIVAMTIIYPIDFLPAS